MIAFILQTLLWLLIAFILGLLLGRLLRGLFCKSTGIDSNEGTYQTRSSTVSADASAGSAGGAGASLAGGAAASLTGSGNKAVAPAGPVIDADIAGFQSDNLQIIEGIGPKMEALLHENGIVSWSELGDKSDDDLRGILDQYNDKYQMIDPSIWIPQAKLAAEGQVDELITLQKKDGVSKLENMIGSDRNSGFGSFKPDDLKIVEGIGPKIEELLNTGGINTWLELSKSKVPAIQTILDSAGANFRLADPDSWPLQAELANNSEWVKLKEYQDVLQGGRSS